MCGATHLEHMQQYRQCSYVHVVCILLVCTHTVKTSMCGVCHYWQPCVYSSVHENHGSTHTTQRFNVMQRVRAWCVGNGMLHVVVSIPPSQRHARSCVCGLSTYRFTLSVDS